MRRRRERGFALIVAILLAAILLIGVLGALHLGARRLDAQRTEATRRMLPEAFRAVFPYGVGQPGGATAPSLYSDFGYRPDPPTAFLRGGDLTRAWDLKALVDRSSVGASDGTFAVPPSVFDGTNGGGSWNGPYWRGVVDGNNRPVDAWGRYLELRYVTAPTSGWIVHSAGANGKDDTTADSGEAGGDDLVFPAPPYVVPSSGSSSTFSVSLNLVFVLRASGTCGSSANNVFLTVVLSFDDGSGKTTLTAINNAQLHRNGAGKPNQVNDLSRTLTLKSAPAGSAGRLDIAVTGGCPDGNLSQVDFDPSASSGLVYLGSSTSGSTTTYSFNVTYSVPPSSATPWPITIQP